MRVALKTLASRLLARSPFILGELRAPEVLFTMHLLAAESRLLSYQLGAYYEAILEGGDGGAGLQG